MCTSWLAITETPPAGLHDVKFRANAKNAAAVYISTCSELLLGVTVQHHSPLSAEVCELGLLLGTEASVMTSQRHRLFFSSLVSSARVV